MNVKYDNVRDVKRFCLKKVQLSETLKRLHVYGVFHKKEWTGL